MKLHALAISLLSTVAAAQSTVSIGSDSRDCNGNTPSLLSDGSTASALATFSYDANAGLLDLTVVNTTPLQVGSADAVITRIYFNAPKDTITEALLVAQTSSTPGSAAPNFTFGFDADAGDNSNPNRADCFGHFNFRLASPSFNNGIAHSDTDDVCGLKPQHWVLGPVTFTFQLTGPGIHGLTSEAFAASTSRLAASRTTSVAMKFDGAGCESSGTLANDDACRTAVFMRGTPTIGETVDVCVTGSNSCGSQLGVSLIPGPTFFKDMTVPIGVPVVTLIPLGYFVPPTTEFCVSLPIPFDLNFVGLTLYWANVTNPIGNPADFSFSPAFEFTVGGFGQQNP